MGIRPVWAMYPSFNAGGSTSGGKSASGIVLELNIGNVGNDCRPLKYRA